MVGRRRGTPRRALDASRWPSPRRAHPAASGTPGRLPVGAQAPPSHRSPTPTARSHEPWGRGLAWPTISRFPLCFARLSRWSSVAIMTCGRGGHQGPGRPTPPAARPAIARHSSPRWAPARRRIPGCRASIPLRRPSAPARKSPPPPAGRVRAGRPRSPRPGGWSCRVRRHTGTRFARRATRPGADQRPPAESAVGPPRGAAGGLIPCLPLSGEVQRPCSAGGGRGRAARPSRGSGKGCARVDAGPAHRYASRSSITAAVHDGWIRPAGRWDATSRSAMMCRRSGSREDPAGTAGRSGRDASRLVVGETAPDMDAGRGGVEKSRSPRVGYQSLPGGVVPFSSLELPPVALYSRRPLSLRPSPPPWAKSLCNSP